MGKAKSSGFTLIELLIVIGIITLLAVALLPSIISSRGSANILADQANLTWHYQRITQLRDQKKAAGLSGHMLVLGPWCRGVVDKTAPNRDRYFNPALAKDDPRYLALCAQDVDKIWPSESSVTPTPNSASGAAASRVSYSSGSMMTRSTVLARAPGSRSVMSTRVPESSRA